MKKDLTTSIAVAVLGVIISYFVCNLFMGPIEDVNVLTVDASVNTEISEPNPEIFNYKAVNPTVEVYVGDSDNCEQYNDEGECISSVVSGSTQEDINQGNP